MDGALSEFAAQGYGASSVNAVCAAQGVSKGIVYHYFETKDALYLACVEECFERLTSCLNECFCAAQGSAEEQLERYFAVRVSFFRENPVYQPIFCEAVIAPPVHLQDEIRAARRAFDALNESVLRNMLSPLSLRPQVTMDEVVETFTQFQNFINAKYRAAGASRQEYEARDESCRRALRILLYGVLQRKDDSDV